MDGIDIAYAIDLVITVVLGLLGFFMKRSINEMDKKIEKNEKTATDAAEEIHEMRVYVAREYVTKDDHNATASQIDKKLTRIMDLIIELKERQ